MSAKAKNPASKPKLAAPLLSYSQPTCMFQKPLHIHSIQASGLIGRRFLLLFLILLGTLIFYPYAETNAFLYFAFRTVENIAILLSVYAVGLRRSVLMFALVLAIPAVLQHNLLPKPDQGVLSILNIAFSFVFDLFIIVVIFRRVFFNHDTPNSETIFGALCVYLLIGFTFASVYQFLAAIQPRAFYLDPTVNVHSVPDRFDLLFFSFTCMTSLGASGMVAISRQARSFSVIESIIGVLFLAVLVARLMGAYRPSPATKPPESK